MAYPNVGFHLTVEGREMLQFSGSGKAEESLVSVYGAEVAKQVLPVLWEDPSGTVKVNGFIGPPSLHRSNRRHINLLCEPALGPKSYAVRSLGGVLSRFVASRETAHGHS